MIQDLYIKGVAAASGGVNSTLVMKTNQTTSYRTGDDGDFEYGRMTDFDTLALPNPFGTIARFTDTLGTQVYANDIVLDWSNTDGAGVLGYYRTSTTGGWNTAIDNSLALSVGTFTTGWRLPNIKELLNIAKYEGAVGNLALNYAPFNLSSGTYFWSSTTNAATTANANVFVNNSTNGSNATAKTLTFPRYISVRTFTYTELGVTSTDPVTGAKLLKTGQTTSYRTGDDGDLEEGRAADFLTLLRLVQTTHLVILQDLRTQ